MYWGYNQQCLDRKITDVFGILESFSFGVFKPWSVQFWNDFTPYETIQIDDRLLVLRVYICVQDHMDPNTSRVHKMDAETHVWALRGEAAAGASAAQEAAAAAAEEVEEETLLRG